MKSTLDCIPCFVEHALHVARMVTDDSSQQFEIIKKTLGEISRMELEDAPPEMARKIHTIIKETAGSEDPYLEVKDKSTEFAHNLMPYLWEDVEKSADRFETIVRLVIAGNIIDFGADIHFKLETAHDRIMEVLAMPIDREAVRTLKKAMDSAGNIFYILDNCGEAVLDRLLIELYKDKITLGVRGKPILNDVTRREAEMSGLNNIVDKIIDTGDITPGVSLKYSRPEFLDAMKNADLIIAKGQGNFETLSDIDLPIVFLLRAKCRIVAETLGGVPLGSLHVIPRNINC